MLFRSVTVAAELSFNSSNASILWPLVLRAFSSAITGVNLAVTPPAFLFGTAAGEPLTIRQSNSTGPSYSVALAYFIEA